MPYEFTTLPTEYNWDIRSLIAQRDVNCASHGTQDQAMNRLKLHSPAASGLSYEVSCGGINPQNLSSTTSNLQTAHIAYTGEGLSNFRGLDVNCGNKAVLTQIALDGLENNTKLYQEYKCKNIINGEPQCSQHETPWVGSDGDYSLQYLDNHNLVCGEGESLSSFRLVNGEESTECPWRDCNRMKYTCCKVAPVTYSWLTSEWKATPPVAEPYAADAEAPCFPGNARYRTVDCQDASTKAVVDKKLCTAAEPAAKENCAYVYPGIWHYTDWSVCNETTNKQTRTETCIDAVSSAEISLDLCDPSKHRKTETDCLNFAWVAGTFGTCSNAKQTREVKCMGSDGEEYIGKCVDAVKPTTEQVCAEKSSYVLVIVIVVVIIVVVIVAAAIYYKTKKVKIIKPVNN
jgi:hypothetical protein